MTTPGRWHAAHDDTFSHGAAGYADQFGSHDPTCSATLDGTDVTEYGYGGGPNWPHFDMRTPFSGAVHAGEFDLFLGVVQPSIYLGGAPAGAYPLPDGAVGYEWEDGATPTVTELRAAGDLWTAMGGLDHAPPAQRGLLLVVPALAFFSRAEANAAPVLFTGSLASAGASVTEAFDVDILPYTSIDGDGVMTMQLGCYSEYALTNDYSSSVRETGVAAVDIAWYGTISYPRWRWLYADGAVSRVRQRQVPSPVRQRQLDR